MPWDGRLIAVLAVLVQSSAGSPRKRTMRVDGDVLGCGAVAAAHVVLALLVQAAQGTLTPTTNTAIFNGNRNAPKEIRFCQPLDQQKNVNLEAVSPRGRRGRAPRSGPGGRRHAFRVAMAGRARSPGPLPPGPALRGRRASRRSEAR